MPKPFLLLDNYVEPGALPHFKPWLPNQRIVVARPADEPLPADPTEFAGVLMSGSAASIFEEAPWMRSAAAFSRLAMRDDVPVLGCCFGHQLLAYAVCGIDGLEKASPPEVGYLTIEAVASDPLVGSLGEAWRTFVSHEDQVKDTADVQILARSAAAVHGLRVPGSRAWGVQFHVEYPLEEEARILNYRADKHPELGIDVEGVLTNRANTDSLARALFGQFVKIATSPR